MRSLFHSFANRAAALFVKLLFGIFARVHVLHRENANRPGGFLLVANHISHFDPFLISTVVPRKIDWMTMAEFFRSPLLRFFLRAVDAFPAERGRAKPRTIRAAIARLKDKRVVGLFPEGGIRDGARSLLEGALLRPGAEALAHIAGVPVLPCVILGSDRLYSMMRWLPFQRAPIWIAFGDPIPHFPELQKTRARRRIESELPAAFQKLYAEVREKFRLTADDLPHSARERIDHCGASALLAESLTGKRRGRPTIGRQTVQRTSAKTVDLLICTSLNLLHMRHRLDAQSREDIERYIEACKQLTPHDYYATPNDGDPFRPDSRHCCRGEAIPGSIGTGHNKPKNSALPETVGAAADQRLQMGSRAEARLLDGMRDSTTLAWYSPVETKFPANNIAHAEFFQCEEGMKGPTVFLLHSLMSASRIGYRRCAASFNALGWNACFVHLPYHYSRVPPGYLNGELAITPDLIRNAEGLRQGVIELRQLMSALREHGCREFGVLGTSYGGWIGALLALVERDFRFVALMSPIVNLEHAIWQSPAARRLRHELCRVGIEPSLVARHFHLSSPLHGEPLCDPTRVLFVTGEFDAIAPPEQIEIIHQKWGGSELLRVRQGHFGYRMLRETIARIRARGDL